jgi:hypothetical protein
MPLGGANIGWVETDPPDTASAGLGDDEFRSLKTALRNALDSEHNWPSGGGADTGYHRLGSARVFVGTQSTVSSSGTIGRLQLTSDTSRLFGVGSGGTSLFGGATVLLHGTFPTGGVPQRSYWAVEMGQSTADLATADGSVTFDNSGFSSVPRVCITSLKRSIADNTPIVSSITEITTTTFAYVCQFNSGTSAIGTRVQYIAIGDRTL